MSFKTCIVYCVLVATLAACGGTAAEEELPTPTPLPPAPALERPTYTVQRGAIERTIEPNGRVTPVDLVQLSFHRSGRVETVNVQRNDPVVAGDVLAELMQDDELADLRDAEDALVQAERDLQSAQEQRDRRIRQAQNNLEQAQETLQRAEEDKQDDIETAERDLQDAHRDLGRLFPGGAEDVLYDAQKKLDEAQREATVTANDLSKAKTDAEHALIAATETLKEKQQAYSDALWDKEWVEDHGTDPTEELYEEIDPETGDQETQSRHAKLTDEQKEAYRRTFEQAQEDLRQAEREFELAKRAVDLAREQEIYDNQKNEKKVRDAQRDVDDILSGESDEVMQQQRSVEEKQAALQDAQDKDLSSEETAVKNAELELEEAFAETFNAEIKQVETAQRELEKARKKVDNGRIIAPQNGEVLAINMSEGEQVEEFDPVVEIADPANLEVSAELSGEHMRQLAEGQPAEISLLTRPDVTMDAVIRRMPAPYGSGGSGIVQEQDKSTRFAVRDAKGQTLTAGAVVKIRIVLERKEDVLLLPPDAIRSFEGRTFVVVREGDRERRVTVKTGIETPDEVEIVEGLQKGDVVVGQ